MTNITREVQRFLDHDLSAKRDLARGLINTRALAVYLKKHLGSEGSIDAIISAIRRYESGEKEEERFSKARALIKNAKISIWNL